MATAGLILIGNELLSGKIQDLNGAYLIRRLRGLGVDLQRIVTVPDSVPVIRDEVQRYSDAFDHDFTSGGVGPTHDDVNLQAVALAFDRPHERNDDLADIIERHFKERTTDAHLRMADLPNGTELLTGGEIAWPVICVENLYLFPGVPELFRIKFEAIAERFREGAFFLRSMYLRADEGTIAESLAQLETTFPVSVGSYPRLRQSDYKVRITIESKRSTAVNEATEYLVNILGPASIVRVDDPVTAEGRRITTRDNSLRSLVFCAFNH